MTGRSSAAPAGAGRRSAVPTASGVLTVARTRSSSAAGRGPRDLADRLLRDPGVDPRHQRGSEPGDRRRRLRRRVGPLRDGERPADDEAVLRARQRDVARSATPRPTPPPWRARAAPGTRATARWSRRGRRAAGPTWPSATSRSSVSAGTRRPRSATQTTPNSSPLAAWIVMRRTARRSPSSTGASASRASASSSAFARSTNAADVAAVLALVLGREPLELVHVGQAPLAVGQRQHVQVVVGGGDDPLEQLVEPEARRDGALGLEAHGERAEALAVLGPEPARQLRAPAP